MVKHILVLVSGKIFMDSCPGRIIIPDNLSGGLVSLNPLKLTSAHLELVLVSVIVA